MSKGQTQLWADGTIKWKNGVNKNTVTDSFSIDYGNVLNENLIGCDVKTDVLGVSMKIERNGTVMKMFEINNIVTWTIDGNIITIFMKGSDKFRLVFMNMPQAIKGELRLYLITNGANIQGCEDELQQVCGRINNANVTFS